MQIGDLSRPDPYNGMHWFFALIAVCVLLFVWGYVRGKREPK